MLHFGMLNRIQFGLNLFRRFSKFMITCGYFHLAF